MPERSGYDVVVVGAGIIGLACAWRARQRGLSVVVVEGSSPASGASGVAAGMLAPVTEVTYGEEPLLRLSLESLRRYPAFVAELEAITGHDVGLRGDGTLVVATDAGDRNWLADLHAFQQRLGLTATLLTSREARQLEPMLAPAIRAALLVDADHSVDNRRLAAALLAACETAGVAVRRDLVQQVTTDADRVTGVRLESGEHLAAASVVLAAGPWSAHLPGVPEAARPPVRPVKGQILRLHAPAALLPRRSVRGLVAGSAVYLVPRANGELVVGATMEDMGFDTTVRAGAVHALLRDARSVLPAVDEYELVETMAALRPGSPDNVPIVGRCGVDGLVVATGHGRNGVLLTPLTADVVVSAVVGADDDAEWASLVAPQRFAAVPT